MTSAAPPPASQSSLPALLAPAPPPVWGKLGRNETVVTRCGVEVRLRAGTIHSPILYWEATSGAGLAELRATGQFGYPGLKQV